MKRIRSRHPWVQALLRDPLILPFYIPSLVTFLGHGILSPVLPLYAEDFGASYAWVGAFMSAQALGMLLTDLPSGLLLRRMGLRRATLLGLVIMVTMEIAYFWAGSIHEAFAYRLFSGFGSALFGVARHAYVTEQASVASRGRALALFGGLIRAGRFIGPPLGGFVAARWGMRVPFLVAGIVGTPAILMVLLFLRKDAPLHTDISGRSGPPVHPSPGRLLPMLRGQASLLLPASVGQIFVQMIRSGREVVIPLYAASVVGLDVGQVGLLLGIASAVEMVMFLPAGWLMDNMGRKYALIPSFSIQAVAMACVPLTGTFGGLLACATAIGLGNGLTSGAMMVLGSDLAPPKARAEFLGVWRLIGDIGGTAGPAAVGFVADALALPMAALAMAASALAAALIFGFSLPETLKREQEVAAGSPG
jgi:MFS family permease